jgi:ATP synthase I chain
VERKPSDAGGPRDDGPGDAEASADPSLRSLERKIALAAGLVLAGIGIAGIADPARLGMLPGAACGAAIAFGNFFLIRKILEQAFRREGAVNKGFVVQYALKFLGLIGIVYLVVRSGWFDVLGFLLGFASLFLGVLLEGLTRSFRPTN